MSEETLLKLEHISKHFAGIRALSDVSVEIRKGEVLAIIGENGAGKSTLMKIVTGIYTADSGDILFEGTRINDLGIKQRQDIGISMVHQEIVDFPNLSVARNIFAGIEPRNMGFVDEKKMRADAAALLREMGVDLDPDALVGELNAARRQMTMIAKALAYNSKLIIMDEPNSALTDEESQHLFRIIGELRTQGISILYISHRLEEVLRISDRMVVLRDGTYVKTLPKAEASVEEMIRSMVGRDLDHVFPVREPPPEGSGDEVVLDVRGLRCKGVLHNISFQLRGGEILGIAGLEGSGRTEMAEAVIGMRRAQGKIHLCGQEYRPVSPQNAFRRGIAYVPPERRCDSILPQRSVLENLAVSCVHKLRQGGLVSGRKMVDLAVEYREAMKIKLASLDQSILDLSGGNQQKVIIARSIATGPRVLIFNEPTRGIDVGAKYEIYKLIHAQANRGLGIVFISSEMTEILGMSERILAFRDGRITGEFAAGAATNESVLGAMMGGGSPQF